MDFKVGGILGFAVRDSFRDLKAKLSNVTVNDGFGFESVMGDLALEGQTYLMGVDQNAQTGAVACIEVRSVLTNDTFEGISLLESTEQTFVQELAKIGSTPVIDRSVIWWPKERMGFYIFEGIPRTIAWWGTDAVNNEVEAIFHLDNRDVRVRWMSDFSAAWLARSFSGGRPRLTCLPFKGRATILK